MAHKEAGKINRETKTRDDRKQKNKMAAEALTSTP